MNFEKSSKNVSMRVCWVFLRRLIISRANQKLLELSPSEKSVTEEWLPTF